MALIAKTNCLLALYDGAKSVEEVSNSTESRKQERNLLYVAITRAKHTLRFVGDTPSILNI